MPHPRHTILMGFLGAVALLTLAPAAKLVAQPDSEPGFYSLDLRKLIDDVELERRVLVQTRRGLVAIPVDSIGKLYASRVFMGELDPDSVAPRARWIRQESNRWLALLKRDLAVLEATGAVSGSATGEYRRWYAPDGTWSMSCQGGYPPEVRGQIGVVERVDSPDGRKWFRLDLYRTDRGLIAPLEGAVVGTSVKGERRRIQIPGPDFLEDVGTLTWEVQITEKTPAVSGVDGTIQIGGELRFRGNEGRCYGLLEAG